MKTVTNSSISYISVSFSSLKVAMAFGVSPAFSVRQSVDMDGAASCLSWTVAVWCPTYSASPSGSATTSL